MQLLHHKRHLSSVAICNANPSEYISFTWVSESIPSLNKFDALQKDSPYTKDINRLILASQEMGFMGSLYHKIVRNSTECQTWQQLQASHKVLGNQTHSFRLAFKDNFYFGKLVSVSAGYQRRAMVLSIGFFPGWVILAGCWCFFPLV